MSFLKTKGQLEMSRQIQIALTHNRKMPYSMI